MKHYTYKITQPSTGFYYIGVRSCHVDPLKDPYMGSMRSWKLTKEEKALCTKEIIAQYDTREEANADEEFMIIQVKKDWKDPNCKNARTSNVYCTLGIATCKGRILSDETKKKISESLKGRTLSDQVKSNIGLSKKGIAKTDEHRAKISAANKGKKKGPLSEDHKAKLRESAKNRKK